MNRGTIIVGQNENGNEIRTTLLTPAKSGDTILQIQYDSIAIQAKYVQCLVGAKPEPLLKGCKFSFVESVRIIYKFLYVAANPSFCIKIVGLASVGNLKIGAIEPIIGTYQYDPLKNNYNARTIQSFSTNAQQRMYECEKCPYITYNKFYQYYGMYDYANQWVLSAFNRGKTNFLNGNADFSIYQDEIGTAEAIKKGTVYMNVWMHVIQKMEDAISYCEKGCEWGECNDDEPGVFAWDEAVAFYMGSIPKKNGEGGYLLYTLAQKRCENFGTCLKSAGENMGLAQVNNEIFQLFNAGQQDLRVGKCAVASKHVERIIQ